MISKIYVGNLPYDIVSSELEDLFAGSGTVDKVTIVTDKNTGRAMGFGFVEMKSQHEADTAIKNLHEQDFRGRSLKVNMAKERNRDSAPRSRY